MSSQQQSIFGRFVLDTSLFLRFCKRNPQLLSLSVTGVICSGLYWRNVHRSEQRMLETQAVLARESQQSIDEALAKLNTLQKEWAADGERKDILLAKLHAQNIQQTRSLDRINNMLQVCRVEVPNMPSSWSETRNGRNNVVQHQQPQQTPPQTPVTPSQQQSQSIEPISNNNNNNASAPQPQQANTTANSNVEVVQQPPPTATASTTTPIEPAVVAAAAVATPPVIESGNNYNNSNNDAVPSDSPPAAATAVPSDVVAGPATKPDEPQS